MNAFPDGHFHSPIPDLAELEQDAERIWHSRELWGIDLQIEQQLRLFEQLQAKYSEAPWQDEPVEGLRYSFHDAGRNAYFNREDGLLLYSMLRYLEPAQLIEVGSGYSSALIMDTDGRYLDWGMRCTFIDPDMSRLERLFGFHDKMAVSIREMRVQEVPLSVFGKLDAGDVLFIDSSHVAKCGSDVYYLLFDVLPRLKQGVYIHFHDIFYPFEYPREWVQKGINFNEAYVLRAFLMHNQQYEMVLWGAIMGPGSSLWIRKK